mgnify:CR=1 FL=1
MSKTCRVKTGARKGQFAPCRTGQRAPAAGVWIASMDVQGYTWRVAAPTKSAAMSALRDEFTRMQKRRPGFPGGRQPTSFAALFEYVGGSVESMPFGKVKYQ